MIYIYIYICIYISFFIYKLEEDTITNYSDLYITHHVEGPRRPFRRGHGENLESGCILTRIAGAL